jgi:hypothetical protein
MEIQSKTGTYKWIENWATIPDTPGGKENGRTHAVAVSRTGTILVFHQAVPAVLQYDENGDLMSSWGDFPGAHGMTLIEENSSEYLWLTDEMTGRVVKTTLTGEMVLTLPAPEHREYHDRGKKYIPTWVAQNPQTAEIWVADGYGASLVHRYSPQGEYQATMDGTEGAGRFSTPHGINITMGADSLELFITDRSNQRVVVYNTDGKFLRSSQSTHSPCCFDFSGSHVVVPELFTGVKILDKMSLALVDEIGASPYVKPSSTDDWWPPQAPDGWPNLAGTEHVQAGYFNSPHGACFAANQDIFVVEWILGGRITKLEKTT